MELKAYKGDVTIPVYGTIADEKVYLQEDADREIARQKRKRCLALAHFCWERRWRPEFDKYAFWHRWGKIWFELADKLKEAK